MALEFQHYKVDEKYKTVKQPTHLHPLQINKNKKREQINTQQVEAATSIQKKLKTENNRFDYGLKNKEKKT